MVTSIKGYLGLCAVLVLHLPSPGGDVLLHADFDGDADGFAFAPDVFRGTSQPGYVSGSRMDAGGFSGGALRVILGGVDDEDIVGMSGGWSRSFAVTDDSTPVALSFRFRISQSANYEDEEYSQVLVAVDGLLRGHVPVDYVGMVAGDGNNGPDVALGWTSFRVNLGTLSVGDHTVVIGGYNNQKTVADESTEVLIDDVLVATTVAEQAPDAGPPAVLDGIDFQRFVDNIEAIAAFGPRVQGSDSYDKAEAWLIDQLQAAGYTVEHDTYSFQGNPRRSTFVTKVGVQRPDLMFIVSAHFDGVPTAGGAANDDGSGCSLVLEAARAFAGPGIETDVSVRFVFWNNEETGLNGSSEYVNDRFNLQGREDPPGSGVYPEPWWIGMVQHDQILWDHGLPSGPEQIPAADLDIEYRASSGNAAGGLALANALLAGNAAYSTDYPAEVTSDMSSTDSMPFRWYCAAVSVRDNRRLAEIGNGSNPTWHQPTDVFATYSEADFRLGFNAVQMTVGTIAELAGAHLEGGFARFGTGCAGTAGAPVLDVSGGRGAFLGETFQLVLEPLPVGVANLPFGLIGFSASMWGPDPLPLDLGAMFGMPGCRAFINPELSFRLANLGGSSCWDLVVPMNPSLVGLTFYVQGMVLDPGVNVGGAVVSNAVEATIGIR